jgi:formylglycine-generating enzyme required for sulfatase activity
MTRPDPSENAPGNGATASQRFGRFRLLQELGRGAQGVVHLAEDTSLGRKVALKMLLAGGAQSAEVRERFHREAKITSMLDHPGICGLYETGETDGVPYIAMQYVRGKTLAGLLKEARELQRADAGRAVESITVTGRSSTGELQDVVRLVERAARALHAAHEAGLVHRDIKPGNIMVTPEGDPVLLDFGLARELDDDAQTLTASGQVMGTPAYLAPEQIIADRERIDRRTDVYALGVTLFECLTLQRPYDAPTWDQLYHKILEGAAPNPRKLNPRIPRDLRTVIEVAMEREPKRRYPTALAFAEDLKRVRSREPILAKAAGMLVRTLKWARRRPGHAAAVAFAVVLGLAGGIWLGARALHRRAMVQECLQTAAARRGAADFDQALAAVAQALVWDPDSARAVELRSAIEADQRAAAAARARDAAYAAATAARAESAAEEQSYERCRQRADELRAQVGAQRAAVFERHASEQAAAAFAQLELGLAAAEDEAERHVAAAQEGLQRALRHEVAFGDPSAATERALADFYARRWREAVARRDGPRAAVLRAAVAEHDCDGAHRDELREHGALAVATDPADAEVFLFRYLGYETVRSAEVVPRLVPVAVDADGAPVAAPPGFGAGDPCLRVTAVAPGSPAAAAGLRADDLVIGIADAPAHDVRPAEAAAVAKGAASSRMVLRCLRAGEPLDLDVPAGAISGLDCEPTAYPLLCGPRNRISAAAALDLPAGSYLLFARRAGRDTLRLPVQVDRGATAQARLDLLPGGSTPPGFVWVPPGPFRAGGDARAFQGEPAHIVDLPGYCIARDEVSTGEWLRFLADPRTQQALAATTGPGLIPRDDVVLWKARADGSGFDYVGTPLARGFTVPTPATPVFGVSWLDAQTFLAWRNAQAASAGEPWVYDLPTANEYEKAARGVDGRAFPWGDRFDPSLTVCQHHQADWLLNAPSGLEPRDESVYGVRDLAGSREEWLADPGPGTGTRRKGGGSWASAVETIFHAAGRGFASEQRAQSTQGLRLVARRPR